MGPRVREDKRGEKMGPRVREGRRGRRWVPAFARTWEGGIHPHPFDKLRACEEIPPRRQFEHVFEAKLSLKSGVLRINSQALRAGSNLPPSRGKGFA